MEALEFIKKYKNINLQIAPNRFFNIKEAISYIKKLYKLGCSKVEMGINEAHLTLDGEHISDDMYITLPKSMSKRLDICAFLLEDRPDEAINTKNKKIDWKKDKQIILWWD